MDQTRESNHLQINRGRESQLGRTSFTPVPVEQRILQNILQVALAMKCLTSSRKVIEVLNRLGHSISCSAVEEIETELAFEGTKENHFIPQQMIMDSDAGARLAFDNFDCFVETLSDTLNNTVGIAYQISTKNQCQGAEPEQSQPVKAVKNNKRRRVFQASGLDIEPY